MNFDINKIIDELKKQNYPIFVQEGDLQAKFLSLCNKIYPTLIAYAEFPQQTEQDSKRKYYLDLVILDQKTKEYSVIEFKYVLSGGEIPMPGNDFYKLRDHSASDIRRHDCIKDISRLENIDLSLSGNTYKKSKCYFLLITNDESLWNGPIHDDTADKEFNIADGVTLIPKEYKWAKETKTALKHGSVFIKHEHLLEYKVFSYKPLFKYLVVEI